MNERQRELWVEWTRCEKDGAGAVLDVYRRAVDAAGKDCNAITDIALTLQRKNEDAFFSDEERMSLYPMMYDLLIRHAGETLDSGEYHRFCRSVYEAGARRWLSEVYI